MSDTPTHRPLPACLWCRAHAILAWASAAGMLAGLGACSLLELRQQSDEFYASTVLVGRVTAAPSWAGPVVVVARPADDASAPVVAHALLHEPGGFELIVPKGRYHLQAFGDGNGNLRVDAGEPVARYRGAAVVAPGTGLVGALDMALSGERDADHDLPVGFSIAARVRSRHSTQAGAIADLDDAIFSAERGRQGYWEPMSFFRELGGNIYFLEPYDRRKTPVLFVHGAAGSPQDWRYFIAHLDRERYQPWVFYYPSGAAVESMSYLLYWKLLNLWLKHGFERLVITAHSMGGLVARSFLVNHGAQFLVPKLFVSVSTPWGGEPSAEMGVRHSPAVVPSWHDMRPEGRFVRELFLRRLPPQTEYHLLFGHKGGYSLMRPNTDGTVTLASQLKSPAQQEARRVLGFDEDHTSILSSPEVFAQYAAILGDAGWRARGDTPAPSGGVLRLQIAFEPAPPGPRPMPLLVLDPMDAAAPRLTFSLPPDEPSREIGPLPPGLYQVTLVTDAFRSEPPRARVTLRPGQAAEARFAFVPQGTLFGYVGTRAGPVDHPAGSYLPPDDKVRLRSITLEGAGIRRTLVPRQGGPEDSFAHYADGKDDALGPYFSFVGLPAGDYELTILAEGREPYRARHAVMPGRPGPLQPVLLTPLR
jgi:pimeloyl-ACP methyl ester carboxylesterase